MHQAEEIVRQAFDWLRDTYDRYTFYVERDIVWTLQNRLTELVRQAELDLRIYNDYLVLPGKPRAFYADLVLVGYSNRVEMALEVKYEPAHTRLDILQSRLPVVFWGEGVVGNIDRVQQYVGREAARAGWSLLIDEGGYFRNRFPPPDSAWHDWDEGKWALISRFP